MLPETLCAGDATSPGPLIPFEVTNSISLSLWNLGRLYKLSLRRISSIISPTVPSFPPVSTHYHTLRLPPMFPSPQYYPLIIPRDCCFPSCVFFFFPYSRYSREILRPDIQHDHQTNYTNPKEAATGADVKSVERLCRVETSEKVSRTLVTIPLPPHSSWHGVSLTKLLTIYWRGGTSPTSVR